MSEHKKLPLGYWQNRPINWDDSFGGFITYGVKQSFYKGPGAIQRECIERGGPRVRKLLACVDVSATAFDCENSEWFAVEMDDGSVEFWQVERGAYELDHKRAEEEISALREQLAEMESVVALMRALSDGEKE